MIRRLFFISALFALVANSVGLASVQWQGSNPYRTSLMNCYQRGMYSYRHLLHIMRTRPNDMMSIMPVYMQYTTMRVRYAAISRMYWRWERTNKNRGYMTNLLEGVNGRQPNSSYEGRRPSTLSSEDGRTNNYNPSSYAPAANSTAQPETIHHGLIDSHNIMADVVLKVRQRWSFSVPCGTPWHEQLTNSQVVRIVEKEACQEEGQQCVKYTLQALKEGKVQYTLSSRGNQQRELNFAITVSNRAFDDQGEDSPPNYGNMHYSY